MVRVLYVLWLFVPGIQVLAADVGNFRAEVKSQGGVYNEYTSRVEVKTLFHEGRVSEANQGLIALVPDNKKTFYDYFILGNMLFQNDPQTSYDFMVKAEQKAPDNPYILFERGLHEHRRGNYVSAQAYYEKIQPSKIFRRDPALNAYLTHTYLMTGNAEAALTSWNRAGFAENHTAIEKAMYAVFSTLNQEQQRGALIAEIKNGQMHKLCDLHQLDSNWEMDWWNHKARPQYLEYDHKLVAATLTQGSTDEKYFQLCTDAKTLSEPVYLERLKQLGLFGPEAKLPASSTLIYEIVSRLTAAQSMSPAEVLDKFEHQLVGLSKKHPQDTKYFDVLAFLYANTGKQDKLKAIDRHGWKELKIEKYALSYLAGMDHQTDQYLTYLDEALNDFPLSVALNQYKLSIATKDKEKALLRFVAAQFANVKNNWSGPYRLNDYMASLKHELEKIEN